MNPSLTRTPNGMVMVPEQWGASTADVVAAGAVQLTRAEILSRFGQTKPVEDQRLAGEVAGYTEILVFGKIGSIDVRLLVQSPDSLERYRIMAQCGWIYCAFERARFAEIAVLIDGSWTTIEAAL